MTDTKPFDIEYRLRDFVNQTGCGRWACKMLRKHFGDLVPPMTTEKLEAKVAEAATLIGIHATEGRSYFPKIAQRIIRQEFTGTAVAGEDWKAKCEAAERALRSVDIAIGNRSIFDGLKDRTEKINYAIGWAKRAEAAERERDALAADLAKAKVALEWYGEQARLCRLIHHEGDAGRNALSDDGGEKARQTIAEIAP